MAFTIKAFNNNIVFCQWKIFAIRIEAFKIFKDLSDMKILLAFDGLIF
jgi:hypothetical protein